MIERLKMIMSIHRYYEVCLYIKSKQDMGLFQEYTADTVTINEGNVAAWVAIKGITDKIWDKVISPEITSIFAQREYDPYNTSEDRVRYHVQIATEEP